MLTLLKFTTGLKPSLTGILKNLAVSEISRVKLNFDRNSEFLAILGFLFGGFRIVIRIRRLVRSGSVPDQNDTGAD